MSLAERLKLKARELGAELAGIAAASPLHESSAYHAWLEAGMQGTMDYMARNVESRDDITAWYPEAKSVLICGFSYADHTGSEGRPESGRLARYSVLPDYHDELKGRLKALLEWLKTESPRADGRVFVDTSPLLERLYARYAGVGWVAKNTMLISPKLGSYFFLAGLALNIELPADEPVADHCGSCTRCLSACPTDAFPRERVLDASRCIAYFTIEHKGPIPEGFREGVGDWVLGCDVCQEVCPFNRFARNGRVFSRVMETSQPLEALAALDEPEFKRRFGGTPVSRPKRRGIIRNALLAMGNSRDPRHRATLERFARDPDPVLREQAAWSLARLPVPTQE
ncbi:MAG: tRNA epoxyqueuosine(34) reductase QueG [Elusimicrobia bacterium]|nr:tRNA epoxyqueuosine(34) reductase QueG [Elusimicrobiota bacterium]